MVPTCGEMAQLTPAVEFCTVAVKWTVCPLVSDAVVGEIATVMVGGGCSVMVAVPVELESKVLVAVTVIFWLVVIDGGAVYKPLLSIVPVCGLILHVTSVWLIPLTVAVNACVWP